MIYYKLTYPYNPNTYSIVIQELSGFRIIRPLIDIQIEPYKVTPRKGNYTIHLPKSNNLNIVKIGIAELSIAEVFALKASI